MNWNVDVDWDEELEYRPGVRVEIKAKPGTFDTIAEYDPTMVPSIWLENDPRPRYPHELRVVSRPWVGDSRFCRIPQPTVVASAIAGRE